MLWLLSTGGGERGLQRSRGQEGTSTQPKRENTLYIVFLIWEFS